MKGGGKMLNKNVFGNVCMFIDIILSINFISLAWIGLIKTSLYAWTPAYWLLFLITAIFIIGNILSLYYKNRTFIILTTLISTLLIFISSLVLAYKYSEKFNTSLLLWIIPIISLVYISLRSIVYLK